MGSWEFFAWALNVWGKMYRAYVQFLYAYNVCLPYRLYNEFYFDWKFDADFRNQRYYAVLM